MPVIWLVVVGAVILGLVAGSVASVPIHRWPRGMSVTWPQGSICPACGGEVAGRDALPLVAWVRLRGRCPACHAPISPRYLVVEVVTGALFGAVAGVWGLDPLLPALLVLTWTLVVATAIDLEFQIIPNRLTYRLPVVLLPLVVGASWADGAWADLRRGVITAIALPGIMLLLSEVFRLLRGQSGIGMGDIKFAVSLGLVVGYLGGPEIIVFVYATVIAAVVIGLALIIAGRARLASRIPFGPYLAAGAMLVILAGDPLVELARAWLGLGPAQGGRW